jgi:hypothetical protein
MADVQESSIPPRICGNYQGKSTTWYELMEGELYEMSPTGERHGAVTLEFGSVIQSRQSE